MKPHPLIVSTIFSILILANLGNASFLPTTSPTVSQLALLAPTATPATKRSTPIPIPSSKSPLPANPQTKAISSPLASALAITAGNYHTCALTTSGGVKCWGHNGYGQLGDGTVTQRLTPVDVSGLTSGASAITAGRSHTCGLMTGGGVKCWGDNSNGQLGDGTQTNRLTPVNVSGLTSGISAIAAGYQYTCALTTSGGVKCWGNNWGGQLGDGTVMQRLTPVDVSGLTSGVSAIVASGYHTCALTTSGGVKCWGYNWAGQLGDGTMTQRLTPVDVSGLTSGVSAITAGGSHTCALMTGGGVKCWGYNGFGQLGDGTVTQRLTSVNVSGLTSGVSAIAAGNEYTCALTTSGGVKCWGRNGNGQLGNGTTTNWAAPADVSGLTGAVSAIGTGYYHTCAVTMSGTVKCWGDNGSGQLGDGTSRAQSTPVIVSGLTSGVSAIAAGLNHTCALTAGGGVKCWGGNYGGQLGDGTLTDRLTPVNVSGLTSDVSAINARWDNTCALTTSGGVKCWGHNGYGQLGDGTMTSRLTPVNVIGLTSGVSAIAVGLSHTCGLMTGGGVKCWGDNSNGQLGDGTQTNRLTPVNVSGLTSGASAIAAGYVYTCALTTSGGVKCWGNNFAGQLGDGTVMQRLTPVDVSGLTSGVSAIVASGYHTCALTTSGGVKCWGNNWSGQIGDGTTTNRATPVDVNGLTSGVSAISAGASHTCALTTSGGVKCWGNNGSGELGDDTTTQRLTAVNVSGLTSGVGAIAAGDTHTCALMTSGSINCWGDKYYGKLGNGETGFYTTPRDVVGFGSGVSYPPIVFVHGWNGFILANPPESGFQKVANALHSDAGYTVVFADIQSNALYTPPIEQNVPRLRAAIDLAKAITGQSKVILIAHSMGGLVSRAYIEGSDYKDDVKALFTFGSPHQGVPEVALAFYAGGMALPAYCAISQPAVCEFSTPGMFFFNRRFPNRRSGVEYHVISGDGSSPRSTLGKIMGALILGSDDAAVPLDSGIGLTGYLDRRQTDEVHASQLGPRDYFIRDGGSSVSYTECLKKVLVDKTAINCGTPSTRHPQRTATTSTNHTPYVSGTLQAGQTFSSPIQLEGGSAIFASQWQTGTLTMTLVDPNSQPIDPAFASANPGVVTYEATQTLATYSFPGAIPGTWHVVLQGTSVPAEGSNFFTFAIMNNTSLTLSAQTDQPWYVPGAVATLTATLAGSPTSANVTAVISRSDGITQTVNLVAAGTAQYQGAYTIPNVPGYVEARVAATGTDAGGASFQREASVAFQIASNRASLSGSYNDTPEPRWPGASLYKALLLNAGINSSVGGGVGLSADLVDLGGNIVAHGTTVGEVTIGTSTLTLRFDAAEIFASNRSGPYRLTNLLLTDQTTSTLVIAEATNAYTTAFYDWRNFAVSATYLPIIVK